MKILALGDIFGKPGRQAVRELLPKIVRDNQIDFVIANTENAAGGKGLSPKTMNELFGSSIDVMTAGNHIWEIEGIYPYLNTHNILRPVNTKKKDLPGKGWGVFECKGLRIGVVALQGEVFMDDKGEKVESPFKMIPELLLKINADIIIVDFHAETTSEKRAIAWFLDGKVSAVLGTHTHVQTSDEEILPGGTAYITDLGMTGPHGSVIGLRKEEALHRFLTGETRKFKVATDDVRIEGVILTIDEQLKKVVEIKRIRERVCST